MGGVKRALLREQDNARRPATLGDLAREAIDVFCWCNRCGHNAVVPLQTLIARLGPACRVPEIGLHMRCAGCGAKDVAARPNWPSPGQVTNHV
jgi:hypothetical protein